MKMEQTKNEPKRIRGTAAIYDDGAVDFRPQQLESKHNDAPRPTEAAGHLHITSASIEFPLTKGQKDFCTFVL